MEKLFLLDAYALIYRAYYALIRTPRINSKGFNTSAIFGFVNTLEELLNKENPSHIGVAFDPTGPTFRHQVFPQYKAQRESTPEDIRKSVPIIKDIIRAYDIPILEVPGYEADDVIGTIANIANEKGIKTFMVTPDKDYGQLITENVIQYRPGKNGFEKIGINEILEKYGIKAPEQIIDILGLMGDAVDNIPGCPSVGEKTAGTLIKTYGSIEDIYKNIENIKGKLKEKLIENKEQVLFSKYLVTIKKDVPISFNPEELKRNSCNHTELRKIFEQLEFRSFIHKICDEHPKVPNQQINQLDLFDTEADVTPDKIICENFTPENYESNIYKSIDNQIEIDVFFDKILTKQEVAFSLSTDTQNAIDAKLIGISIAIEPNKAFMISCEMNRTNVEKIVSRFKEIFESTKITKIGHDLKFAQIVLSKYHIKLQGHLFDTMIAHYLIQPELSHRLGYISEIYLHHIGISLETYFGTKWNEERNMSLLPEEVQTQFECQQADNILRLKPRLKSELENYNEHNLFSNIEMPLVSVLAEMEEGGVLIDPENLKETSKLFTNRMNKYEQKVFDLAKEQFNLSSPKQVGEIFFGKMQLIEKPKKTKSGQYVTSEPILEELRYKFPIVDYLLKYRGMKKLVSTYLDALPNLVNIHTGHIHTSFNQAVTSTGRLSSSNPNLQNIPIRGEDGKEIRKAFIPESGCEFFSADYSQIELRIMAHLSQDPHLIDAFLQGFDIHAATAAKVYHKNIESITPDERRKAKTANFGIIYGITVFGLAQRIGISRTEAKALIDNYFSTFPGVRNYMDNSITLARSRGYVETIFHRRRYLPDITSGNATVRGYAERNAINAPIQGSAADIIKVAMINISRSFHQKNLRSKMILQVHDELNFSVFPEEKQQVKEIVTYEMEHAYQMRVPLVADCGWGKNWLEAH